MTSIPWTDAEVSKDNMMQGDIHITRDRKKCGENHCACMFKTIEPNKTG